MDVNETLAPERIDLKNIRVSRVGVLYLSNRSILYDHMGRAETQWSRFGHQNHLSNTFSGFVSD